MNAEILGKHQKVVLKEMEAADFILDEITNFHGVWKPAEEILIYDKLKLKYITIEFNRSISDVLLFTVVTCKTGMTADDVRSVLKEMRRDLTEATIQVNYSASNKEKDKYFIGITDTKWEDMYNVKAAPLDYSI